MWLMLQQDEPDDYVIATGKTHKVSDFVEMSLRAAGLSGEISEYVDFDQGMIRPSEVELLVGDPTKARTKLGWEAKVDLQKLVDIMVKNDLKVEEKSAH
jgi:GDPmannose 4,6-dehydratase